MAEIIEFVPGLLGITREMAELRRLHASLLEGSILTSDGVDVTAREARILAVQIAALEAALSGLLVEKVEPAGAATVL